MPESNQYTTISLHKELKAGFESLKDSDETNNEVMRRALVALREKEDREKSRWEWQNERMNEQSRLLVRMADELGLDPEQIPGHMAEVESRGETATLKEWVTPPEEEVSDMKRAKKQARWQAKKEVKDLEVGDDGFIRPAGYEGDHALFPVNDDEEVTEQIEQRMAEILLEEGYYDDEDGEPDEGYTDSFADSGSNEGDF